MTFNYLNIVYKWLSKCNLIKKILTYLKISEKNKVILKNSIKCSINY